MLANSVFFKLSVLTMLLLPAGTKEIDSNVNKKKSLTVQAILLCLLILERMNCV